MFRRPYVTLSRQPSPARSRHTVSVTCAVPRCRLVLLVYMVQDWSFLHYALPSAHLGRSPSALVARVDRYDTVSDLSKLTAPDSVVSVDSGVDPVALRPSHRTARPDVVIKVARRTVLRELQLDADRAICVAVVTHIEGNVLRVRCVPYRRYSRRTWCATGRRRDGKRAWCQVRPARRRVHGWAWPTRW